MKIKVIYKATFSLFNVHYIWTTSVLNHLPWGQLLVWTTDIPDLATPGIDLIVHIMEEGNVIWMVYRMQYSVCSTAHDYTFPTWPSTTRRSSFPGLSTKHLILTSCSSFSLTLYHRKHPYRLPHYVQWVGLMINLWQDKLVCPPTFKSHHFLWVWLALKK